jgi:anaerobic dimethyl sulfoxide reductase subunit B (iron-sulfur subunit)
MACKDLHDLPVGVNWGWLAAQEGGVFPNPRVTYLFRACYHCARPECVDACPEGALVKRASDGVVLLDREHCLGCLACVDACPYGAIQVDQATGAAGKCDLCVDLTARGEEPACVAACVMSVLTVGWLDEMSGDERPRGWDLPDPDHLGPSFRVTPHRHSLP